MRNLTVSIVLVALLGLAVAEFKQTGDPYGSTVTCVEATTSMITIKCGTCSKYNLKMYKDDANSVLMRNDYMCTTCSNGKTPATAVVAVPYTSDGKGASTAAVTADVSTRCFAAIKAFSTLAFSSLVAYNLF